MIIFEKDSIVTQVMDRNGMAGGFIIVFTTRNSKPIINLRNQMLNNHVNIQEYLIFITNRGSSCVVRLEALPTRLLDSENVRHYSLTYTLGLSVCPFYGLQLTSDDNSTRTDYSFCIVGTRGSPHIFTFRPWT